MGDHLAELVLGEAVVESALQMPDELFFAAERDECRAGDQAAVALGESRALPDFAEQYSLAEIDQSRHDVADLLAGRRGLCLRHGFLLLDPTVRSGASLARGSPPTAIISVHARVTPASRHAPFRARRGSRSKGQRRWSARQLIGTTGNGLEQASISSLALPHFFGSGGDFLCSRHVDGEWRCGCCVPAIWASASARTPRSSCSSSHGPRDGLESSASDRAVQARPL